MMAIAVAIDASDGTIARALRVRERIPYFDGALLDNIVDYLNYVAAPMFLMLRAKIIPSGVAGEAVAGFVMVASAYGFSRLVQMDDVQRNAEHVPVGLAQPNVGELELHQNPSASVRTLRTRRPRHGA